MWVASNWDNHLAYDFVLVVNMVAMATVFKRPKFLELLRLTLGIQSPTSVDPLIKILIGYLV